MANPFLTATTVPEDGTATIRNSQNQSISAHPVTSARPNHPQRPSTIAPKGITAHSAQNIPASVQKVHIPTVHVWWKKMIVQSVWPACSVQRGNWPILLVRARLGITVHLVVPVTQKRYARAPCTVLREVQNQNTVRMDILPIVRCKVLVYCARLVRTALAREL